MEFKNDMTMMFAIHDALRRELGRLARVTERVDDDPNRVLRTAAGWQMFTSYLHIHHTTEDQLLWPPMREALTAGSQAIDLLDAMEAEHAAIDPLLDAIDRVAKESESGQEGLGELVDALTTNLGHHLDHEEKDALPVIDVTVTPEQWQTFGGAGAKLLGSDVSRFIPWVLESATPEVTAKVLGMTPPPVKQAYLSDWQPVYAGLELWPRSATAVS